MEGASGWGEKCSGQKRVSVGLRVCWLGTRRVALYHFSHLSVKLLLFQELWIFTVNLGDTVSSSIYNPQRVGRGKGGEDKLTSGQESSVPSSPSVWGSLCSCCSPRKSFHLRVAALVNKVIGDSLLDHHC